MRVVRDRQHPHQQVAPLVELMPVRQRTLQRGLHQVVGGRVVEHQRARIAPQTGITPSSWWRNTSSACTRAYEGCGRLFRPDARRLSGHAPIPPWTPSRRSGVRRCGAKNRVAPRLATPVAATAAWLLDGQPVELTDANFDAPRAPNCRWWWTSGRPGAGRAARWRRSSTGGTSLRGRALLVKVNSDDNPGAAARFGIRSIPRSCGCRAGARWRGKAALPARDRALRV